MIHPKHSGGRIYQILRNEGIAGFASAMRRYTKYNVLPYADARYWRGRLQDEVRIVCGGAEATFDTSDPISKQWFYPRYLNGEIHEPVLTRRLLDSVGSGTVFYDVGSNLGYHTVLAASLGAESHAFELDPSLVRLIRRNLDRNGLQAAIVRRAIGSRSDETVSHTGGVIPEVDPVTNGTNHAETLALDDYVADNPSPDVVKIDVEGYEFEVLRGAERTFSEGLVSRFFVEIHPDKLQAHGHTVDEVISMIERYGYEWYVFDDHRHEHSGLHTGTAADIDRNTMVLCQPPSDADDSA